MKKRLISLLVALCMAVTLLPVSALTAAAEEGSSSAKLEIAQGGYPNGSNSGSQSCSGTDWSYDKDTQTLTLSPSTPTNYDFSNNGIHTGLGNNTDCNIIIGQHATVTDGYFHGVITNHGTIIGGRFYSSVTNESDGIIENGQFGIGSSPCTVTNNGGTINGGTFKDELTGSGIELGYTLTATMPIGFEPVMVNGYRNSCYIIPNQASVSVDISYRFDDIMYGRPNLPPLDVTIDNAQPTLLSDWCGSNFKIEFDGMRAYEVTFTAPPANGSTVTISPLTRLVIDENGYPVGTEGGTQNYSGNGWSYNHTDKTLTLNPSTPTSYDFFVIHTGYSNTTDCNLIIGKNATVTDGHFIASVTNNGTIKGGIFKDAVTNHGTIIGGRFFSSVTNELDGIIENGQFGIDPSPCTVTNNGGTINGGTFKDELTGSGIELGYTLTATMPIGFEHVLVNKYRDSCYIIPNQASVSVDIRYHFDDKDGFPNLPPLDVTIDNAQHMLLSDWCGSDLKIEFDGISGRAYKVTFTAPSANGSTVTISPLTRLVIDENGYPVGTEGGTRDYSGNGWKFEKGNSTLTLTSGSYDFSALRSLSSDVHLVVDGATIVNPEPKPDPKPEPTPDPEPETPTYTLTVKGGTFTYNGGEAMTSASVPVDAEVKVTLNQSAVPEGMVFDLWTMDEASLLGNPAVAYNEESFTIPAGSVAKGSTVTVEAQYRDATIESEPSILGTAAIIGVAGAGTAVIVWQGYRIGMELYEKYFQPTPEETAAEQPAPEAPAAAAAS